MQEALDMNVENDWKVSKIARLLPGPLYLAYANLTAYADACDSGLSTSIVGDEFEAKQSEANEKYLKDDDDDDVNDDGEHQPEDGAGLESDNDDNDAENVSSFYTFRFISL